MDRNFRSLIDVNNDGYPDIVGIGNCTTGPSGSCVYISYNSGGKGFQGYSTSNGNPSINVNPVFTTASGTLWGLNAPIFVTDVDSDGFVDLFGFGANKMYDSKFMDSLSATGLANMTGASWVYGVQNRFVIDLNSDNLPDVAGIASDTSVCIGGSSVSANTSKLNFSSPASCFKLTPVTVTDRREQTFADLNMDGYLDLVIFDCAGVYVMMNAGGFKFNAPKLWNTDVKTCDKREKGLTDVDGDGLSDIYEFYDDKNVRIALNKNKKPKLIRVVDSFANEKTIKYGALYNNLYSSRPTIQITESMVTNGINFDVVTEFGSSDGAGGKTTIQYQYGNYYCNKTQGRSACSFSTIKYQNFNSSLFFVDDYYLEYPLTGSIKSKKSYLSNLMLK